jgi:aspartyl/asparaginyl-tRNA synthetase
MPGTLASCGNTSRSYKKKHLLLSTGNAMIHDVDMPMYPWEEAYNTVVYIMNRRPHRILKNKTPKEAFILDKPHVSHFHVFHYPMYMHIFYEKRSKLEPSSMKAYTLYLSSQQETVMS